MARIDPFKRRSFNLPQVPSFADRELRTWAEDITRALALPLDTPPSFLLRKDANQTIADATATDVTWQTIVKNQGFGLTGTITTLSIPRTGWYVVGVGIVWDTHATGVRVVRVDEGGTKISDRASAVQTYQALGGLMPLLVDDVMKIVVLHTAGAPLDIVAGDTLYWAMTWIAPLQE